MTNEPVAPTANGKAVTVTQRRRCGGAATAVVLLVLGVVSQASAQGNSGRRYYYDDGGRLIKVLDASDKEIDYIYDSLGNILEIKQTTAPASGVLAIINVTPGQGPGGSLVRIEGQGFGATPSLNIVRFN